MKAKVVQEIQPIWVSVAQAAEMLQMSRPHTYRLVAQGVLPSTKIGQRLRVKVTDIEGLGDRHDVA